MTTPEEKSSGCLGPLIKTIIVMIIGIPLAWIVVDFYNQLACEMFYKRCDSRHLIEWTVKK